MSSPIIAFFNNQETLLEELKVPINDRAYLFGDAVYEVLRVYHGRPFLFDEHMARLRRSLEALRIKGVSDPRESILKNIAANHTQEGMVYLQISRGTAPRNHSFHDLALSPNILIYTKNFSEHPAKKEAQHGMTAITHDDLRWGRCDIKTINLLANCLAQSSANQQGCQEAILIRNNLVTEGSSCNVFLVHNGVVSTPPLDNILPGTRRAFLMQEFLKSGVRVEERPIEKRELFSADEVFVTSTVKEVIAITAIDGKVIGSGVVGPVVKTAQSFIERSAQLLGH